MKITEFLNTKQKDYAVYDNYRSIANYIDGLKSSSRKVLFSIDNFKTFTKVDTIAQTTSLKTQYLHGATNLEEVVKGMTSDYAGTNNISFFKGQGFFGNRVAPEAGASRYVKACKNKIIDLIYRQEDNPVLEMQEFEGYPIEPKFYVPIIPMILINNNRGIGNGFSQTIYSRNIADVCNYLKSLITGDEYDCQLKPHFNNYNGLIYSSTDIEKTNQYITRGVLEIVNTTTINITEIPIETSVDKYIKILNDLEDAKVISDYKDKSNKNNILFEIKCPRVLTKEPVEKLYRIFKLESTITDTLTTIDENNGIKVFDNVYQIISEYFNIRLEYYQKRKDYILKQMSFDLLVLQNKMNFIKNVNDGIIDLTNKTKKDIEEKLYDAFYDKIDNNYDYLLDMKIYNLTLEKLADFKNKIKELELKIEEYKNTSIQDIWLMEIDELLNALGIKSSKNTKSKKVATNPKPKEPKQKEKINIMDLF